MANIKDTLQSVTESRERKQQLFDKAFNFFLLDICEQVGNEIKMLDQEIEQLKGAIENGK